MWGIHEFQNNIKVLPAIAPQVGTDNTAMSSGVLDMRDYIAATLVILTGVVADADTTVAVTLFDGNAVDDEAAPATITDSGAVSADALVGTLAGAGFTFAADNAIRKVTYVPNYGAGKRYLKATVTPSANSGNLPLSAVWLLYPRVLPVT